MNIQIFSKRATSFSMWVNYDSKKHGTPRTISKKHIILCWAKHLFNLMGVTPKCVAAALILQCTLDSCCGSPTVYIFSKAAPRET